MTSYLETIRLSFHLKKMKIQILKIHRRRGELTLLLYCKSFSSFSFPSLIFKPSSSFPFPTWYFVCSVLLLDLSRCRTQHLAVSLPHTSCTVVWLFDKLHPLLFPPSVSPPLLPPQPEAWLQIRNRHQALATAAPSSFKTSLIFHYWPTGTKSSWISPRKRAPCNLQSRSDARSRPHTVLHSVSPCRIPHTLDFVPPPAVAPTLWVLFCSSLQGSPTCCTFCLLLLWSPTRWTFCPLWQRSPRLWIFWLFSSNI